VITVPELPLKALGFPPSKTILPDEFEKVGSTVHKEKMEPVLEIVTTSSSLLLKFISAPATLAGVSSLLRLTLTEKVFPTSYVPSEGERYKEALTASVLEGKIGIKNKQIKNKNEILKTMLFIFSLSDLKLTK